MPPDRSRPLLLLGGLAAFSLLALLISLVCGGMTLDPEHLWSALWAQGGLEHDLIWELRLPRALSAFAVGGLLALAGALMQVLLRNPLGDPYILGISGGAATASLLAMLAGASAAWLTGFAFGGALASMLLVFALAHGQGAWTPTRLLLTGVVIAAGWGALISLILAVSPAERLPGMLFWLMGDLSDADRPALPLLVLTAGSAWALLLAPGLNLLARGELQAAALGVEVRPLRLMIFLLASLLTAAAVTVGGSIGFVGLVAPHLFRLGAAGDHRLLIPGATLLGGSLLLLADTLARTLLSPQQLPVGVVTALLGVPVFLWLLHRTTPSRAPG
ncbi:MAG TPA: iron ABC transporter permease [Sedimenticola sp.]|nr:iron ABC transporter permease [Sedimenticola sp.]